MYWFQLAPPPISEDDARKGIMSLIERGLIPPAAQLTLDPSPVRHRALLLHDPDNKKPTPISGICTLLSYIICNYDLHFHVTGVKLISLLSLFSYLFQSPSKTNQFHSCNTEMWVMITLCIAFYLSTLLCNIFVFLFGHDVDNLWAQLFV